MIGAAPPCRRSPQRRDRSALGTDASQRFLWCEASPKYFQSRWTPAQAARCCAAKTLQLVALTRHIRLTAAAPARRASRADPPLPGRVEGCSQLLMRPVAHWLVLGALAGAEPLFVPRSPSIPTAGIRCPCTSRRRTAARTPHGRTSKLFAGYGSDQEAAAGRRFQVHSCLSPRSLMCLCLRHRLRATPRRTLWRVRAPVGCSSAAQCAKITPRASSRLKAVARLDALVVGRQCRSDAVTPDAVSQPCIEIFVARRFRHPELLDSISVSAYSGYYFAGIFLLGLQEYVAHS